MCTSLTFQPLLGYPDTPSHTGGKTQSVRCRMQIYGQVVCQLAVAWPVPACVAACSDAGCEYPTKEVHTWISAHVELNIAVTQYRQICACFEMVCM